MGRRNKDLRPVGRGMRRGQTIVAERERMISDSERMNLRKKTKRKKTVTAVVILAAVGAIGGLLVMTWTNIYQSLHQPAEVVEEKFTPKVAIEDASGSGLVTARMREYVGMLEHDFQDLGFVVTRAVVPAGRTREVDVYLEGRNEYYKTNLDRGTGVTVEDAVRMMKYLDKNEVGAEYVDVRVTGKGYYR